MSGSLAEMRADLHDYIIDMLLAISTIEARVSAGSAWLQAQVMRRELRVAIQSLTEIDGRIASGLDHSS